MYYITSFTQKWHSIPVATDCTPLKTTWTRPAVYMSKTGSTPPETAANALAAPDGAASPLQLPQLNSLAQPASPGPADGDAASSSRLPKQKQVTQQIMPHWLPRVQSNQAPPDDRCKILRKLTSRRWLGPPLTPRLDTRVIKVPLPSDL